MIATALVFALGALVASFVALIFAPVLWSNAQRLARREFEASIPTDVREMRGEIDAARARAAFELRSDAMRHRAAREAAARERAEAGRVILENGQLLARQADLDRQIADSAGRTEHLESQIQLLVTERDALLAARQDLRTRLERRDGELATLSAKHQALSEGFDQQRFRLATAEARAEDMAVALRAQAPGRSPPPSPAKETVERPRGDLRALAATAPTLAGDPQDGLASPTGNTRLRAAIALGGAGKPSTASADHAEIRERIGDIAARVIHERIKVEGPESRLARIIADAPPPADAGEPLLADRVRRLQADETPVTAAPAKPGGAGRARRKSRR
ncbi:hypothetical protein D3218_16190 [Aureimonas flava]|uniref:Uncharacterized protein n=1 Tax=Aureimonas flava TaxID=2320271 RepID=A0A3A1WFI1_9HYPH|nr:hypothetical protein [Aureimonas flava]RIX98725.1 hypothetical protein D3218_16190 [Aureimonas flava]